MNLSNRLAANIANVVAEHVGADMAELRSSSRTALLADKRAEVAYVLRQCGLSFYEVGSLINRDHSSVVAACRKIEARFETHVGYKFEVEALVDVAREVIVKSGEKSRMRERLENTRTGLTHHFVILAKVPGKEHEEPSPVYEVDGYVQTGEYEGGRLGEIFIKCGRQGDFHAVLDMWAISTSVALQRGASVNELFLKFINTNFEPSGATTNSDIPRCSSVLDYVAKWVLLRYGKVVPDVGGLA